MTEHEGRIDWSRRGFTRIALFGALAMGACDPASPPDGEDGAVGADAAAMDAANGIDAGPMPRDDAGATDAGRAMDDAGPTDGGPPPLPDTGPPTCADPDTWFRDLDGDAHGDPEASVTSCDPVEGFTLASDDCDDGCASCHPGGTETCSGADDDCDGEVDETEACAIGESVACTTACGTAGTGACTSACAIPTGDACTPPAEICNGEDEDCDGVADDGFACAVGATTTCTTSCGSVGTGTCTDTCGAPAASACTPPSETCNGADDDCDGMIDETFTCAVGEAVSCTSTCGSAGTGICTASCQIPSAAACTPPTEVCNGVDDDCDGTTDDGFTCAAGSTVGCTASCGSSGTGTCTASCELPTGSACAPPSETCNGADDDCDGAEDDGFTCSIGETVACATSCGTVGTGACTSSCDRPSGAACIPPSETCNGHDDDCDGARDDTFACVRNTGLSCTTSCGSTGGRACSSSCTVPSFCEPPTESCTYSDSDCDGRVDEGVREAGPVLVNADYFSVDRPHVVDSYAGGWALWRGNSAIGNQLWGMNRDGTERGGRTMLPGTGNYDLEANLGGVTVYAYVESGDVHVHRLESTPSASDPFEWSRTIAGDAVEVHLAVGSTVTWVYTRELTGEIRFWAVANTGGALSGGPYSVGTSSQRISVASNGYREHLVSFVDSLAIIYKVYDNTSQQVVGLIPRNGRAVNDHAIVGDYDYSPITRRGLIVVYSISDPNELRYTSWRTGGANSDQQIGLGLSARSDTQYSQMDLRMRDGVALLGYVHRIADTQGYPRAFRMYRRTLGATLTTDRIALPYAQGFYQGASVVRLEDTLGLPDRVYYHPPTTGTQSVPIGCF